MNAALVSLNNTMTDETRYYLGFNLINGIGPARLDRLIEYCGSLEAAWFATAGELFAAGLDSRSSTALITMRRQIDLDAEMERAERAGVQLITRDHAEYPPALRHIPGPPPLLYVRGQLSPNDAWAVAVVGTRSPTTYGKEITRRVVSELAASGVTIISGLAIGIDSIAHTTALEANGRTIAVLPCGADLVYPERHTALASRICNAGAIVSELPLGTKPLPQLFPVRNRLISGLSRGVLVTEAREKSGALITVDFALEQGRDVFAIPGEIFSRASDGPHKLIKNGACLVTSSQDILDSLDMSSAVIQQEVRAALPEDPVERAVLEQLSYQPQYIDDLCRLLNAPIDQVSATLAMLELKGLARQSSIMHYVLVR